MLILTCIIVFFLRIYFKEKKKREKWVVSKNQWINNKEDSDFEEEWRFEMKYNDFQWDNRKIIIDENYLIYYEFFVPNEYQKIYKYKIDDRDIIVKLIFQWIDYAWKPENDVEDWIVLEADIINRNRNFKDSSEKMIEYLKKECKWHVLDDPIATAFVLQKKWTENDFNCFVKGYLETLKIEKLKISELCKKYDIIMKDDWKHIEFDKTNCFNVVYEKFIEELHEIEKKYWIQVLDINYYNNKISKFIKKDV